MVYAHPKKRLFKQNRYDMTTESENAVQDPIDSEIEDVKIEDEGQSEPATETKVDDSFVDTDNDRVQARINKITAEKYAEKRARKDADRRIEELETKLTNQTSVPSDTKEPTLEDFDYDEDAYMDAKIDFKVNQKASEIRKRDQEQYSTNQAKAEATERNKKFNENVVSFMEKTPDYAEVLNNVPELPPQTLDAVMQADNGPELAYYLGKHLDVADEIVNMDPMQAAMKLGSISAQLAATSKTVKTSTAPDPVEPIVSGSSIADENRGPAGATYE